MGFFAVQGWQPLSDTGAILASGTLTFSRTGTATAKNAYSDKALSSAVSNPLTLDSAGRTSTNIFLLEDEGYRVVLKNSAGTTIWTRDEVFGLSLAVDEGTRRKEIARSPFDHAAVGDGSTNDATALAAALAAADGVLDLEGKTYRCDSTLALRSGITIRNGTLDFSNASISAGLQGAGTTGSSFTIGSVTSNDVQISGTLSGYSPGDLVRIRSDDTIATGHKYAELFRVDSTSGGLNGSIFVMGEPMGSGTVYATSPVVEKVTPVSNIRLENLVIVSPSGGYAIDLSLCEAVRMVNVVVRSIAATESIRILSCYDVDLNGVRMIQRTSAEAGGIIIGDATNFVRMRGCIVERSTAPLVIGSDYASTDGITRNVEISDCQFVWCHSAVIDVGAHGVTIANCRFASDFDPTTIAEMLKIGGNFVTVRECEFTDTKLDSIKVTLLVNAESVVIENNRFEAASGAAQDIEITDTAFTLNSLVIRGNQHFSTFQPVLVSGTTISNLEITDNTLRACVGSGVLIDVNSADAITHAVIARNKITAPTQFTHGIRLAAASSGANSTALIEGNTIDAAGVTSVIGILSTDTDITVRRISGNMIYDCRTGISTVGGVVHGNTITTEGNSADVAISITGGAARCTNNVVSSSGTGIYIDECTSIICNGNEVTNTGTGAGIEIDNTTQEFNGCVVSGNWIDSSDTSSPGIEVDASDATGSTALSITGNYVNAAGRVIWVTGIITGVAISGNTCVRDNDTSGNIVIAGDGAGNMTQVAVSGNHLHNGTYGIDVSNNATTYHSNNTFSSMATGNTNGTFVASVFSV